MRGQFNTPSPYKPRGWVADLHAEEPDDPIKPINTLGLRTLEPPGLRRKAIRQAYHTVQYPAQQDHLLPTLPKYMRHVATESVRPSPLTKRQQQLLRRAERRNGITD